MSLRLAVATEDFGTSLKKAIGRAAACRADGVRLNTRTELNALNCSESANREILLYIKERQMGSAGLMCPTRHALYDEEHLQPRLDVIRKSMALVRQFETDTLLIRCGHIPDPDTNDETTPASTDSHEQANPFSFANPIAPTSKSPAQNFAMLCEILNDLCEYGNHVGCTINLQLASYDQRLAKRLLGSVKTGPIKIAYDSATAIMTGASVDGTYRDLYDKIGYIRARDAVHNIDGAGTEVCVGDGVVDWVQFFPTLLEADYAGWACVERTGGDSRAEDVARGVSYLKTLIPQTGD